MQYVGDKTEFTTTEIIENCLELKLVDTRSKALEMKIASLLKSQGYKKKHNGKTRYWTR